MALKLLLTAYLAVFATSSPSPQQHTNFKKLELNTTGLLLNTTLTDSTTNVNLALTSQTTITHITCPPLCPLESYMAQVNASLWAVTQMNISSLSAFNACSTQQFTIPCNILFDPDHAHFLVCAGASGTSLFQIAAAWSSWYLNQAILDLRGLYEDLQTFNGNGTKPDDVRCRNLPWDTMIRAKVDLRGISKLLCDWVAEPLPGYRSENKTMELGCEDVRGEGHDGSQAYDESHSTVDTTTVPGGEGDDDTMI
ncbi:hypothetical protein CBER1_06961 [Cercospora berteroae]|uniref:Ecp2 effector protein domain-containing protein n=1 Tax=Cercospora berteroae TaxID=357750 RepID=A0A2S6C3X7_9PEZI|nr:hypothetical protein CBER1_06961 [Cercospora berteroae]